MLQFQTYTSFFLIIKLRNGRCSGVQLYVAGVFLFPHQFFAFLCVLVEMNLAGKTNGLSLLSFGKYSIKILHLCLA